MNSDFSDIAAQLTNSLAADGQTTMTGPIKAATGSAANPSYTFGSATNMGFFVAGANTIGVSVNGIQVASFGTGGIANAGGIPLSMPVGTVVDFAGGSAPSGWLLCASQLVSTTTYAALFAVIGYTYGGSGVSFRMPDCRGRTTYGKDNMGGTPANRITIAGGNIDGTILGNAIDRQNEVIGQNNLPNVNFTGTVAIGAGQGSHIHTTSGNTAVLGGTAAQAYSVGGDASVLTPIVITIDAATLPSMSGTASVGSGGSGVALPTLSNGIIFNKIIFAGA